VDPALVVRPELGGPAALEPVPEAAPAVMPEDRVAVEERARAALARAVAEA
jgi:hypothetical protein